MSGRGVLLETNKLEQIIEGASLLHNSVEAHNCIQLKRWLKCHGRSQNGNKRQLVERVKNAIKNNIPVDPTVDKGKWLNILNKENQTQNISTTKVLNYPKLWQPFPSINVPKNFNYGSIYHYLVTSCIDEDNDTSDIENMNRDQLNDYSTSKSLKRGKLYVDSGHLFDIFNGMNENKIFCMKCKIQASFKGKKSHNVAIMIDSLSAQVIQGTCDCKASSMGRCSHVAALLYFLLNYVDSGENKLPCTSKLCTWNQGRKNKMPHKADEKQYKNKINIVKRNSYDPGRSLTKPLNHQKRNNLISDLQTISANNTAPCMWELLLKLHYDDYDLEKARKSHLRTLVYRLTTSMSNNVKGPIDITFGVQDNSVQWWQFRKILITASNIKKFVTDKTNDQMFNLVNSYLWINKTIITPAMQYGRINEETARQKYINFTSKHFSFKVERCGLWVNSKYPGLGASPDGLVMDPLTNTAGVLEIKCPKILENHSPTDLHLLTPQQRNSFCCTSISNTAIKLKKNHPYYYQIQTQMAITERLWCDFVVWTAKALHIERIFYDKDFIDPILKRASAFHQNILAPEYFEMRIPRHLSPFDLSK